MELCLECGTPDIISRNLEWSGGGSIVSRLTGKEYVFLDSRFIEAVYDTMTFLDGERAGLIIRETRRRTVKEEALQSMGFLARNLDAWFIRRRALTELGELSACFGYGSMRIRSYEPSRRAVVEVLHPYFLPFVEAEVRAYWEAVEGGQPLVKREVTENAVVMTLEARNGEKRQQEKKTRESSRTMPRLAREAVEYTPCSTCKSPIEISRFTWNLSAGTLYDSARETHVCLVSVASMDAIIQELKKHYGGEIDGVISRISRIYIRGLVRGSVMLRSQGRRDFLRSLTVRGEAEMTAVKEKPGFLEITIVRPWSGPAVAGEIAGWVEEREGRRVSLEYDFDEESGTVRITEL